MMSYKISAGPSCLLMAAIALVLTLVCGCGKKPEVYPAEGNAFMKDPAFRAALREREEERDAITREHMQTRAALEALRLKLGGDNVAVTNSPEGAALYAKLVAGEAAFTSNRMAMAALIRERTLRAVKDSELIKAGKAVAIKVPTANDLKK